MTDEPKPPPIPRRRPVRAGDELPTTIAELNRKVEAVIKNGSTAIGEVRELINKKDRLRKAAVVMSALSLLSVLGVAGVQVQRCHDHNAENAKTVRLWEFVIDLSEGTPSPLTPEQRAAQVRSFRSFLAGAYPQRHCLPHL